MNDRTAFLEAWHTWDDACGRVAASETRATGDTLRREAVRMEETAGRYAAKLGMRTTNLRDVLSAWRRHGFDRERALLAVERGIAG